jgi:tRNA 5-methylaminomethyl-2-thiouridine biosynthesis bifunctional protein
VTTYWDADNHLKSTLFDDVYFSRDGGLAESRFVFLEGAGLPKAFAGHEHFRVLELGFGTGLNIWALVDLWISKGPPQSWLHINSIEAYPLDRETAQKALEPFDELKPLLSQVWPRWPKARKGHNILRFPQWRVTISVYTKPVELALDEINDLHNAVFLDGFAPAHNPQMWSPAVISKIASLCAYGAQLATFTAAGCVKRALIESGFEVTKTKGFGHKRERILAVKPFLCLPVTNPKPLIKSKIRIGIVGAGIAGASCARLLMDYGYEVDLLDKHGLGGDASGNPYALVNPRLDAGGGAKADLSIDAHYFANDFYRFYASEALIIEGVHSHKEIPNQRLRAIISQEIFPKSAIEPIVDDDQIAGLFLRDSFVVSPLDLLNRLSRGAKLIINQLLSIKPYNNKIRLGFTDGHEDYDKVILACGAGVFNLFDTEGISPVSGQVEYQSLDQKMDLIPEARTFGHYAVLTPNDLLWGASHERGELSLEISIKAREQNLSAIMDYWPEVGDLITDKSLSRRSVRVMVRDYQPVHGWLNPRLGLISGLGSRGFSLAPYLAHGLIEEMIEPEMPIKSNASTFWGLTRKGVSFSLRSS